MLNITNLAIALLAVTISVFIFTVTLLGNAIQKAKEEEEKAKELQQKDFELKINDLENKINILKQSKDSTELESQLKEFKNTQKKHSNDLKNIRGKYSQLQFTNSIIIPGGLFLGSSLLSELSNINSLDLRFAFPLWIGSIYLLSVGIYKLGRNLLLVQEISTSSEELQQRKMIEVFKTAMTTYDKEKAPVLELQFRSISFPLKTTINTELRIDFKLGLAQGKFAPKAEIWFFIPDGFLLIDPPEKDAWQQDSSWIVPNIRTIKSRIGDIVEGRGYWSFIKLKTPNILGEYNIMYQIFAENCNLERQQVTILVE